MAISIKSGADIEKMRRAGGVIALCHLRVKDAIAPGVSTGELDTLVRDTIAEQGAISNFFGHEGFPGYSCTSVNDEIVHGIPGKRRLMEGDIISVDIGAVVDGFHGDSAWTYGVGAISDEAKRLLADTEAALYEGLAQATAGRRLGAIGHAVEAYAGSRGYGIVREYGGHGIGRQMWEEPHVANHGDPSHGIRLRPGMTLAIEPMLSLGSDEIRVMEDEWTVATADGSWSAHFEHTVAITDGAAEILTLRAGLVVQ